MDFEAFNKIPRVEKLNSKVTITEKLDGTNAQIAFDENGKMWVGSRNRWLQPEGEGPKGCDNFGFARWCKENEEELRKLGPGRHYGEFYGRGIGPRGYGLEDRRLALFNTRRWGSHNPNTPSCVEVVPVLFEGSTTDLQSLARIFMTELRERGSRHVPGYMDPEGLVVYVHALDSLFKGIIEKRGPSAIEAAE
jgi:hypothetical protein